jgi:hypothetical protein
VLEHLLALDLEALAELDAVSATSFLRSALRSTSGSFRKSYPLRYIKSKATMTIFVDPPFSSFCNTEKSVVPSVAGTTTSPSMIAEPALMCQASSAIFLKRLVQSLPRRVNTRMVSLARCTCTRYPSNLISWTQRLPVGTRSIDDASPGSIKPG